MRAISWHGWDFLYEYLQASVSGVSGKVPKTLLCRHEISCSSIAVFELRQGGPIASWALPHQPGRRARYSQTFVLRERIASSFLWEVPFLEREMSACGWTKNTLSIFSRFSSAEQVDFRYNNTPQPTRKGERTPITTQEFAAHS